MEQLPKIVRERLRAGQAADHPDPNLLTAFAENSLSEAERLPVVKHLSRCAECREVVMLATNAADSGAPEATSPAGEVAAVQIRSRPWFQMPVVRWAALAACVGLAAILVIRHEWKQTTPSETNLAANNDANRVARTPPPAPAEAESRQSLAKAQKPVGGPAGKAKAFPVLSASAARPRAKRRAMSSAGRSGSVGREGRELASSSALQITSRPLNASKGAPAAAVNGGTGSAGGVPGKQAMPAMADAVAGGSASSSTPAGQSQSARRVETEGAADVFNSPDFQPKPVVQSVPSAGAPTGVVGGALPGPAVNAPPVSLKKVASTNPPQWTLSSDGVLERSTDSGKTWTKADFGNRSRFRALSATGFEVWAGGADGLLFHSSDGGAHWTQIHLVANGIPLTSTITHIDFTDAQHGRLTTNTGETWLTTDAGHTWQRQ
ncbi:MAG: hypothetical protein KGL59_01380 [Acidobacteriota bacterium]|nr:hypothetical protein [Acidobacteriota bacterium]